jgi:sortase A
MAQNIGIPAKSLNKSVRKGVYGEHGIGPRRPRRGRPQWAQLALYIVVPVMLLAATLALVAMRSATAEAAVTNPAAVEQAAPAIVQVAEAASRTALPPTDTPTPVSTPTGVPSSTPADIPSPTPTATSLPLSGPPTRIVAPAIGLDSPVIEAGYRLTTIGGNPAAEWVVPLNVAGYHEGTAFPGHPGNTVISGHHNMGAEVFRYLVDLEPGDEVILYVGDTEFHYAVTEKLIIREAGVSDEQRQRNAAWVGPTDDERVTLVTCWPYSGNSHRVIVIARPVS